VDYKSAGVDIEKSEKLINNLKDRIQATFTPEVVSNIGGFSGVFDLSIENHKNPLLVTSVDGVGTKLKLAFMSGNHSTIGIDLVAMVVNDIIVSGAKPIFLLDYFATGKLDTDIAESVISGIVKGCKIAGCALIGGETAEMPGFYNANEYDLAAFGVGVIEKDSIVDCSSISKGNKIIGIASSGAHSNGYSLLRKIFVDSGNFNLDNTLGNLEKTLMEELLTPTRIYVQAVLKIIKNFHINGMAHITGGGFIENIPRVLPERSTAVIDVSSWEIPEIFKLTQMYGKIDEKEMFKTFNNGIGFILIVPSSEVDDLLTMLNNINCKSYIIGDIVERKNDNKIELLNYKNAFK
jgi:phosphoribosylformylglycinamidine cyclo-ligase